MKYKVGDKVRVRKDLVVGVWYGGMTFKSEMEKFKGKILEIKSFFGYNDCYNVTDDEVNDWCWTDEMLEPVEKTLLTLEANDFVIDGVRNKRKVLAVLYQDEERALYVMSCACGENSYWTTYTDKDLEYFGYKLFIEKKKIVLELTLDEVAEKYKADKVKIVKKKD